MNPLVPSTPDGVVAIAAVGAVILSAAALLSVIITAPRLPGRALLAWALVVALVPFVGPPRGSSPDRESGRRPADIDPDVPTGFDR